MLVEQRKGIGTLLCGPIVPALPLPWPWATLGATACLHGFLPPRLQDPWQCVASAIGVLLKTKGHAWRMVGAQ